jgi:hypothetical protein
MRCTVSLVRRRKIPRAAHVQTSKRVRALGTAVYKARPGSSSFLPTTSSQPQPSKSQNNTRYSKCLFSLVSKYPSSHRMLRLLSLASKNRSLTTNVSSGFSNDCIYMYTHQKQHGGGTCCVWLFRLSAYIHPTKSPPGSHMLCLAFRPSAYILSIFSISAKVDSIRIMFSTVKSPDEMAHVCFLSQNLLTHYP